MHLYTVTYFTQERDSLDGTPIDLECKFEYNTGISVAAEGTTEIQKHSQTTFQQTTYWIASFIKKIRTYMISSNGMDAL